MSEGVAHVILYIHKVVRVYPMKVYGSRGIAPVILNLNPREGEYLVPLPRPQIPIE
jgi:hypothetical protein